MKGGVVAEGQQSFVNKTLLDQFPDAARPSLRLHGVVGRVGNACVAILVHSVLDIHEQLVNKQFRNGTGRERR